MLLKRSMVIFCSLLAFKLIEADVNYDFDLMYYKWHRWNDMEDYVNRLPKSFKQSCLTRFKESDGGATAANLIIYLVAEEVFAEVRGYLNPDNEIDAEYLSKLEKIKEENKELEFISHWLNPTIDPRPEIRKRLRAEKHKKKIYRLDTSDQIKVRVAIDNFEKFVTDIEY